MAFLLRRPFIYIVVVVVAAVIVLQFSGILSPRPAGLEISSATLERNQIKMNQKTTLTVVIENKGSETQTVKFHIVYTSPQIKFYNNLTGDPLPGEPNKGNYTITYPTTRSMSTHERWSIPITIEGLDPGGTSYTYTIFLEVYSVEGYVKTLSHRTSVQLTVTRE